MKKRFFLLVIAFLAAFLLVGCKETKSLSSITVDTTNAKVTYQVGETFSQTGLVVTAKYSDDSTKTVTNFTVDSSQFKSNEAGTYEITVRYTEGKKTATAKYNVTVVESGGGEATMTGLRVDTEEATTIFTLGDEFSSRGIKVFIVFSDGTEAVYAEDDFEVDSSAFNKDELGEYTIVVKLTIDGQELTGTYKVEVVSNLVTIRTVQDFLDMRSYANAEGVNNRIYTLANDIDLEGVTLEPTSTTFTGTFDGNGYTIKNANFKANANKQGFMFYRIDGAVVKNVRFFACNISGSGANETVALVAGECNNTGATFENIEFSCCTVNNPGQNYAGLLVGRNESKTVNLVFKNITVKNLTSLSSKQYLGCLVGDVIKGTTVYAENCDIEVTLSSANNISVFSGRNRGADVTVKNSVVRVTIGAAGTTSSSTQIGVFADGNADCNITAENVAILKFVREGVTSDSVDMICGNAGRRAGVNANNVYYVDEDCDLDSSLAGVTEVSKASVTSSWMFDTLKLNNTIWEADTNKIIKLKLASANTPSEGSTVDKLILITANVDRQFFKGEDFTYAGLIVTAIYTDGCVIALESFDIKVYNANNEEISAVDFLTAPVGEYTVEVSADGVSETYTVHIVEEVGLEVKDDFAQKAFVVGSDFDASKLVVFVKISDGTHTLLGTKEFTITIKDENGNVVTKLDTVGVYTVEVSRNGFVESYEIEVYEKLVDTEAVVDVYVDASVTTPLIDGKLYFRTISDALYYLKTLQLDEKVVKNVYIAEGRYFEKFTVDMPNVNFIGQTDDFNKVVIAYDRASSHETLDEKGTYGTDGSATVTITSAAVNFTASHIFFKNEFDYLRSTLANKQALAVLCDADRAIFYQCGFTSYQDTLEAKTGRQYYYECYIAGAVDFIFGNNATAVFESCTIKALTRYDSSGEPDDNNGYVVATKGISSGANVDKIDIGYVFFNCNFISAEDVYPGSMSIARPWSVESAVTLISCTFDGGYSTLGYDGKVKSRYFDMSGNSPVDARFFEYDSKGVGGISEAVAGVTLLTEEQVQAYTLTNIFKAKNGLVTYQGGDWVVTLDPTEMVEDRYIVYYELGQLEYTAGDNFVESTIRGYHLHGNVLTGFTVTPYTGAVERIFDEEDIEVTPEQALAKAGVYTVRLFVEDELYAETTFTVKESGTVKVVRELKADDVPGNIERGASFLDGLFTFYGKTDGSAISVSNMDTTDGTNTYSKVIKLSGGKAVASANEAELANLVKIEVDKPGTIRIVASQKNAATATTSVKLVLFGADGTTLVTDSQELPTYDAEVMTVVTFEISAAGTYFVGANANGFHLYSIAWIYEEEKPAEMVEVVKEFKADDVLGSTMDRGTSVMDGLFTFYGKTDGSAISVSNMTVTDGTSTYNKVIKLSGGKAVASANEAELANLVKIEVDKPGTIRIVASQKNAATATTSVKLVLFGADGTTLATDGQELPTYDADQMAVVNFTISEAGTYYVGANANGFHLYSIAWIYLEEQPAEQPEVVVELSANGLPGTIDRGTSFLDGLFTFYGKTDGSAIYVSPFTVTDGTNNYTQGIKLSGGKAAVGADESGHANLVKIVVDKPGTIRIVASQKNAATATTSVKLVLFGADGTTLATDGQELPTYDAELMAVITFTINEAGTYYIGANSNGFHLYSIAWITK